MGIETRTYWGLRTGENTGSGGGGDCVVNVNFVGAINPEGEYNPLTSYVIGDCVSYDGSSYLAWQNTTGNLPTNTDYWQLLSGGVLDAIRSMTSSGEYKVTNIKMDSNEKIVVTYEDTPLT